MITHRLTLPLSEAAVRSLRAGDLVILDGEMTITAGLPTHQRIQDHLDRNEPLPVDLHGGALFHLGSYSRDLPSKQEPGVGATVVPSTLVMPGPVPGTHVVPLQQTVLSGQGRGLNMVPGDTGGTWVAGTSPAMTVSERSVPSAEGFEVLYMNPTTSTRFNAYMPGFIRRLGLRAVGGKGGLDRACAQAMQEAGCVYLSFLGGGCPLLSEAIKGVVSVHWTDLIAHFRLVTLRVEALGPLTVGIDAHGHSLYDTLYNDAAARMPAIMAALRAEREATP